MGENSRCRGALDLFSNPEAHFIFWDQGKKSPVEREVKMGGVSIFVLSGRFAAIF